jgi:hypothetical protein
MSQHRCEQCGAENASNAQFCAKCDFYLGWDTGGSTLDDAPLTSATPVVRETHAPTQKFQVQSPRPTTQPGRSQSGPLPRPAISLPRTSPAAPPKISLVEPEVTIDPVAGGTFDINVQNKSSIVDGYTVTAVDAPRWLVLGHPEMRLLTEQEEIFTISVTIPQNVARMVFVQRIRVRLQVCSVEDPRKRSDAELIIVVPRFGTPCTMMAEPRFIRLRDGTSGKFRVHLDNRNSNYPQRYGLSGSDPEGVVRFTFRPQMIEVPPQAVQSVDVQFEAPAPERGAQVMHTLTVTAANNEAPVETIVNVEHRTSAAPADSPVTLRLDPSVTRKTDEADAEIAIIVDNRRGSRDRNLYFSGRDPEGQIRFGFAQQRLYVRAGEQSRLQARISAALPRPGERIERPFSVICNDGTVESEATGTFGIQASASPITTAHIRLEPEHVIVRNKRKGRFTVHIDNSRGALPLSVLLSGSNPEGAVRFAFSPQRLDIAPGQYGRSDLRVEASRPDGGQQIERALTISANDGVGTIEAQGKFTQSTGELLPILRLVLTLLGGLLVVIGAIRPWFAGGPTYAVSALVKLQEIIQSTPLDNVENIAKTEQLTQPAGRALMLVLAGILLLGILPASGKYTVIAGFLAAVLTAVYVGYAMNQLASNGPAYGSILVVAGGIVGLIGGLCAKRGDRRS